MKFVPRQVEKPWGRTAIPSMFGQTSGRRIGEIWFDGPNSAKLPLLVKYIFTSERLSVQVHPDDVQARERGLRRGKSECWYILEAEPGARLGLGLREETSVAKLREAAAAGFLDELMDWKAVRAGDFFYVPAGTIHAIGGGITLLEFQQNADVTYRLYDYGRPRELHLEEALAVSTTAPYDQDGSGPSGDSDSILVNGPIFSLMRISSHGQMLASIVDRRRWLAPLNGHVRAGRDSASAGECLLVDAGVEVELSSNARLLCGVEGTI